ncbi:hypothetical protein KAK07_22630 [Ideonella sp. 4Y16]|uniref:Type 1 fimbrial protein n=1 Tax=Ideonella aquatica TaxID=2824119 RepID=A0A940YQ15_9BURK|nr:MULTISPECIES: hypothetical protein [Ideonella]MBQ0946155.1 hypothetical protein [Ideonella alba]MBQ0960421.1 hypothetical protein [Ideonella aquatica]
MHRTPRFATCAALVAMAAALAAGPARAANSGTLHFVGALVNPTCLASVQREHGHDRLELARCHAGTAHSQARQERLDTETLASLPLQSLGVQRGAGSVQAPLGALDGGLLTYASQYE